MKHRASGSGPAALACLRAVVALEQGAVDHVAHIADLHSRKIAREDAHEKGYGMNSATQKTSAQVLGPGAA
jgi:hypothetical protein